MPHCKGKVNIHDHGVTVWHDPDPRGALSPLPLPALWQDVQRESPAPYPETRIPRRAAAWVKGLMRWQMPASTVQEITGIHGETIRRIHKQTMDEALVRRWLQTRDSGYRPTCLAVDGFAIHKGHRYATCVMDLGNGKVLWAGKGRDPRLFGRQVRQVDFAEERCKPYGKCQGRIGNHS